MKYATVTNLIKLLPYMNMSLPDFDVMWVQYKDARYGYTFCANVAGRGYFTFDLLLKNDFEFELGATEGNCEGLDIEKIVHIFRLGMVALVGKYKSDLDSFIYKKENGLIV